ncbi:MAG: nuclear transport factor 2 family protein [Pseudomonadota bacterium]
MSRDYKRAADSSAPWTDEAARAFLVEAFADLFDPNNDALDTAKKYMTPDYLQLVDGAMLDFEGFVNHLEVLHSSLSRAEFTFETVIASGNTISDIHIVDAVKKDGSTLRTKVIAFYHMRGEQIEKIDELTHMLEGDIEDGDLGSRISR